MVLADVIESELLSYLPMRWQRLRTLHAINAEVKNVVGRTEELDEFFKRQKEASIREEEKNESLQPIAAECLTSLSRGL